MLFCVGVGSIVTVGLTKLFGKQEKQELPPKEDTDT